MIPDLKTYMDLAKPTDQQQFHAMIEQWDKSQPVQRHREFMACFTCHEVEHKLSQCPKRPRDKVKRVLIPEDKIVHLAANDVMGKIADTRIPMLEHKFL